MRGAGLALWLALAAPAAAQAPDPCALIDGLTPYVRSGDTAGGRDHIDRGIRAARRAGALGPDWAIAFAILADAVRLENGNAAHALRLAEEGLELARAGGPDSAGDALMLETSRAFALADLGRFDEAAAAMTLALPFLRQTFDAAQVAEYEDNLRRWGRGELGALNTSALATARAALDAADAAFAAGDHPAALTAAARAALPPDAGFPEAERAILAAEAAALSARALYLMGQPGPALAEAHRGAALLLPQGWTDRPGEPPAWRLPIPEGSRHRVTQLFYWFARAALDQGLADWAAAALPVAQTVNDRDDWRGTLILPQVAILQDQGRGAAADALLAQAQAEAEGRGEGAFAALMAFYRAVNAFVTAPEGQKDVPALAAAAEAAVAATIPGSAIDPAFVQAEVAQLIAGRGATGAVLRLARNARMARGIRPDTDATRAAARRLAEVHLAALHALDSQGPGALCPDGAGRGCALILALP